MNIGLAFVAALATASCIGSAPSTKGTAITGDKQCGDGTRSGNACLVLHFFTDASVRQHSTKELTGVLHWSLYKDGDVGLLGPGDAAKLYPGALEPVRLATEKDFYDIVIADVPPAGYQVLGYLDVNDKGAVDSGDPVTYPKDGFAVPANLKTVVQVALDHIR